MNYIRAVIARFFHHSVDNVLVSMNKAITRLEVVEKRKADEAEAHAKAIEAAESAKQSAIDESWRAAAVRQKLRDLIS